MDAVHVRVRLFALAKERTGSSDLELALPAPPTVGSLRAALRDRFPDLAPLWRSAMIAVDEEYAGDDVAIHTGTRLAVIPPVSGGRADKSTPSRQTDGFEKTMRDD